MTITTTNQQPGVLQSQHLSPLATNFDPFATVRDGVVKPLFAPLIPNSPVTIDMDGKAMTADDITARIFNCCGDTVNTQEEDIVKEIFSHTLAHYDKALAVQDVYAVQAGKMNNMPLPAPRVIYTPTDVIDASKQLLSGNLRPDAFFATLAFYARVPVLGYYFANDAAWGEFKTWFATEIQAIQSLLTQETIDLCTNLQGIRLNKLTEGFVIRDDETQNNDPYSFARLFHFYLFLYEQNCKQNNLPVYVAGHMPFSLSDNFCPRVILLVNVEKHAHAHPNEIKREWDMVRNSMTMKPKVLGCNKIASLTAVSRMAAKLSAQASAAQMAGAMRSAIIRFRKTAPTSVDLYKYIASIYKHTQFVQKSENSMKFKRMTYQKPSRRDPDNPDRQGKTTGVIYRPNLHVYLDCSGSISEREYQDAIKACIKLAKKMGVDFYFNSFSHVMSQTVKLPVKGKTVREIYTIFKNVPKVGGGTDYEQIWHYINAQRKREQEVSVVISDFEYTAPNHFVKHPRFLYYAPISATNWNRITSDAKDFAKSMLSICPDIRKRILM